MENEEIISLNVREILEDVEQQLVKIGIYSKPVFETEDYGFYNWATYREIIIPGNTYLLEDIDGSCAEITYKKSIKAFNTFRKCQVKDIKTKEVIYTPFSNAVFARICHAETLALVKEVVDYVLRRDLPKRFGGMEFYRMHDVVEEIVSSIFPLHYQVLIQDGLERKDFSTNPLFVLVYNLLKLVEDIIITSKLNKQDVYVSTFTNGFIYIKSLGDYRIIEWEMMHQFACETEEAETGRACSEVDPVRVLLDVSDIYVENVVESRRQMEERALAAKLTL